MNIRKIAQIAQDSYNTYFDLDLDVVYSGGVSNSQFHILKFEDTTIVAITGSNQIKDWFSNILVRRRKNVHRGFLRDFEEIYPFVQRIVTDINTDKLLCVGHSYGGALSCLTALEFATSNTHSNIELITFGQPRVGNEEWCLKMNKYIPNYTRYVNKYDIVAKVPLGFGYKHSGNEVKFARGKHSMTDYLANL